MIQQFIKKITTGQSTNLSIQLFRYLIAGSIAFVTDFVLLWFFTEQLGVNYILSAIIGYIIGLAITYILSVYWVFDQRRIKNQVTELLIFAIIGAIGIGFTSLFIWLFTEKFQLHYLLSKIITTIIVFIWNFFAKKGILFSGKSGIANREQ